MPERVGTRIVLTRTDLDGHRRPHPDCLSVAVGTAYALPTAPLRVAATAVHTTLAVVALPVGVTLMALSLVRGVDMRLSRHAMALPGLFIGLSQTPAARTLLGIIQTPHCGERDPSDRRDCCPLAKQAT